METVKLKFPFFDGKVLHPVGTILTVKDGFAPKSARRLGEKEAAAAKLVLMEPEPEPELDFDAEPKTLKDVGDSSGVANLTEVDGPVSLSELAPSTTSKKTKKGKT